LLTTILSFHYGDLRAGGGGGVLVPFISQKQGREAGYNHTQHEQWRSGSHIIPISPFSR
jgi:hypothetical protein